MLSPSPEQAERQGKWEDDSPAPAGDRCRMKERKKASSLLQANVSGIPDRSPRKCHLSDVKIPAERHLADMKGTTLRSGVGEGRAGGCKKAK